MALQTSGIVLPRSVATVVTCKAKDASTIAALSPAKPKIFEDENYLIFNGGSEAEVIAEGAAKSSYEQPVVPIVGTRFTVQTTTRVSKQLKWADEDDQLEIIDAIQDDQAAAAARALDYVVYHAVSPKTGTVNKSARSDYADPTSDSYVMISPTLHCGRSARMPAFCWRSLETINLNPSRFATCEYSKFISIAICVILSSC